MNAIPITPETLEVARRVIWFEPPERALADPARFIAYAMTYARHEDMRVIRRFVSDDDFRDALDHAPPGIIDPRSWAYWNSKMGRYPAPPLPMRTFGGTVHPEPSAGTKLGTLGGSDLGGKRLSAEEVRRRAREEWLAEYGPKKGA